MVWEIDNIDDSQYLDALKSLNELDYRRQYSGVWVGSSMPERRVTFRRKSNQNSSLEIFATKDSHSCDFAKISQGDTNPLTKDIIDPFSIFYKKYMKKIVVLFGVLLVISLGGCKIFRSKNSDYQFSKNSDSLGVIATSDVKSKLFVLTGANEVLEIDANGYSRVRIGSDGSVEAVGDSAKGSLNVKRSAASKSVVNKADSTGAKVQLSAKEDSTAEQKTKDYSYTAKPDAWVNTWWVLVLGVVVVVSIYILLKKFDLSKFFK